MSGIFGIFNRDGRPVSQETMQIMYEAMAYWGPDGGTTWSDGCCGLGQLLLYSTPEALYENLPRWLPQYNLAITAEARIDNRDELCDLFDIPLADRPSTPDSVLILSAYLKWGEDSADHLLGDWAFAVWHPNERRLFLARDHHGNTSLYYYITKDIFAFGSSKKALLALPQVPKKLNELKLALILVSSPEDGVQTVHQGIQRLPPAHTIQITPEKKEKKRYWYLEETPLVHYKRDEDYAERLLEVFSEAVQCRMRSYRPVGATLSGGLDSGSVSAVAAGLLKQQGQRLTTFSAIPLFDVSGTISPLRFGDETPYIRSTANHLGNVDLNLLQSSGISPMSGMSKVVDILDAPTHAAGNFYWLVDILQSARKHGLGTLLTGQGGNATISWKGKPWMVPGTAPESLSNLKLRFRYDFLLRIMPEIMIRGLLALRGVAKKRSWNTTAINPDFATHIQLKEKRDALGGDTVTKLLMMRDPRLMRCGIIQPGRAVEGSLWAELSAPFQIETRDPTTDKRLMSYTFSVPNRLYSGPDNSDRYLLRQTMNGLLPPQVLDSPRRGRQAADIVARLLTDRQNVEKLLNKLQQQEHLNGYFNYERLQEVWDSFQSRNITAVQTNQAVTVLTRCLMGIMFLDSLE